MLATLLKLRDQLVSLLRITNYRWVRVRCTAIVCIVSIFVLSLLGFYHILAPKLPSKIKHSFPHDPLGSLFPPTLPTFYYHRCPEIAHRPKNSMGITEETLISSRFHRSADVAECTLATFDCWKSLNFLAKQRLPSPVFLFDARDIPVDRPSSNRYVSTNCRESESFRRKFDVCSLLGEYEIFLRSCIPSAFTPPPHEHLATFKGNTYVSGHGTHRWTLSHLEDAKRGVKIAMSCNQVTNLEKLEEGNALTLSAKCRTMQHAYDAMDYCNLLNNSTFAVIPAGRSPATYRFIESLRSGAVPILYFEAADADIELPYEDVIDWNKCLGGGGLHTDIVRVEAAYSVGAEEIIRRQKACESIYRDHFETEEKRLELLLGEIGRSL